MPYGKSRVRLKVKEESLKSFPIGKEVTLTISGKVVSAEAKEEGEYGDGEEYSYPAVLEIEIQSVSSKKMGEKRVEEEILALDEELELA